MGKKIERKTKKSIESKKLHISALIQVQCFDKQDRIGIQTSTSSNQEDLFAFCRVAANCFSSNHVLLLFQKKFNVLNTFYWICAYWICAAFFLFILSYWGLEGPDMYLSTYHSKHTSVNLPIPSILLQTYELRAYMCKHFLVHAEDCLLRFKNRILWLWWDTSRFKVASSIQPIISYHPRRWMNALAAWKNPRTSNVKTKFWLETLAPHTSIWRTKFDPKHSLPTDQSQDQKLIWNTSSPLCGLTLDTVAMIFAPAKKCTRMWGALFADLSPSLRVDGQIRWTRARDQPICSVHTTLRVPDINPHRTNPHVQECQHPQTQLKTMPIHLTGSETRQQKPQLGTC